MIYRPRHLEGVITEALADTRVVIVNGARQAGKSTAVHRLIRDRPGVIERKLDRPNDLTAARLDPTEFVMHDNGAATAERASSSHMHATSSIAM